MRAGKYFGALLVAAQHPFVLSSFVRDTRQGERASEGASEPCLLLQKGAITVACVEWREEAAKEGRKEVRGGRGK